MWYICVNADSIYTQTHSIVSCIGDEIED